MAIPTPQTQFTRGTRFQGDGITGNHWNVLSVSALPTIRQLKAISPFTGTDSRKIFRLPTTSFLKAYGLR